EPRLPYGEAEFDAAGLCVSVDYLTQPVAVLRDAGRVLRPGAPLVITFSNRCFPTKVVSIWQELDDVGHVALVARMLAEAGNWEGITRLDRSPRWRGIRCLRWWGGVRGRGLKAVRWVRAGNWQCMGARRSLALLGMTFL